jgi:hypothetical protein
MCIKNLSGRALRFYGVMISMASGILPYYIIAGLAD